jgi:positive regulator of sigma E activity
MKIDYSSLLVKGLLEGIVPLLKMFLAPILIWVLLPGIVAHVLFKRKEAYGIGAFVGLVTVFIFVIN